MVKYMYLVTTSITHKPVALFESTAEASALAQMMNQDASLDDLMDVIIPVPVFASPRTECYIPLGADYAEYLAPFINAVDEHDVALKDLEAVIDGICRTLDAMDEADAREADDGR